MTREPVGFLGLGVMGSAMSGHLLAAGHPVPGFDPDAGRRADHEQRGGSVCASPAEVARVADVVVTSLPSAAALMEVLDGTAGLRDAARPGLVVVETSTLSPETKREGAERAAAFGATLLDCPMSGTGQQARDGDLVAYLSGDEAAKERARPVLAAFTRAQYDLGAFGQGTAMKLVANLLVAVHNAAAAEALLLAQRAGLDLDQVLAAVGDGAGGSRMLQVRGPLMAAGRYSPATATVATMQKDNGLIAQFAHGVASPTPLFSATTVLYEAAVAQDRLTEDTACVFGVLQRLAGQ
ncbi:NAD-binding of NADP-dependent 3-hydroxyisobutyrate dehydrogenase [Geodermatophilus africanus]|uniref:NAD-binding of NADP-dependent 3-hydroxyisobutyrate dehydrogenase n=1 Tax=Geodermatophilus africanus TaxID=1137993 RepID=A0A1H3EYR1_9ACTN|nr:NAD(P)-dependent oxidoreductase [Geodermatophilus africanus]SDX83099.1 NAD-binding of NADP-dependent 3-hydroxyisobutyrate dehydrogenase [Geodermatophilus africanus]